MSTCSACLLRFTSHHLKAAGVAPAGGSSNSAGVMSSRSSTAHTNTWLYIMDTLHQRTFLMLQCFQFLACFSSL